MSKPSPAKKLETIIRLAEELRREFGSGKTTSPNVGSSKKESVKLDYEQGDRYFFKEHGKNLSGPKRFVLVVAYLTNGDVGKEIKFSKIEEKWNKMAGLLGGKLVGRSYATRAKNGGWVKSTQRGLFSLTNKWVEIFS